MAKSNSRKFPIFLNAKKKSTNYQVESKDVSLIANLGFTTSDSLMVTLKILHDKVFEKEIKKYENNKLTIIGGDEE